jgi:hypothetical protein
MIEVGDLLGPGATLLAVALAIFVFALARALERGNKSRKALLEIDVPDSVKEQKSFRLFVFGDSLIFAIISVLSLVVGIGFVIFLHDALKLFFVSPVAAADIEGVVGEFRFLLIMFFIALLILLPASLALFTTEVIIGEKKLPLLARVYARSVRGRRSSKVDADSLLPEAKKAYRNKAFGETVLYSVASLELALRDKLDVPAGVGFGRLISSVSEKLAGVVPVEELIEVRKVRNIAAHPSAGEKVTKKDAERVLQLVEDMLQRVE